MTPGTAVDLGDLLVRTGRGDESAFAVLYDELSPAVYGMARRVVRDPSRAEEISQEVFIQLWKTAARFDAERGSAKGWVLTMAHRRAVDAVRHDQAASNRDRKYISSNGPEFDEVEESVTLSLEHEQVRRCLAGLTDLQREAVNLAYYQGYTYAEVAEALNVNPATIKTRIRDGIVRLRDCMGIEA
ncbi:RNA polymerase subunit sigma [Aeromicrobium sp. Root344]|nr:RNA polymerase subunit sigma [Aeromicrobium sp. Root344]